MNYTRRIHSNNFLLNFPFPVAFGLMSAPSVTVTILLAFGQVTSPGVKRHDAFSPSGNSFFPPTAVDRYLVDGHLNCGGRAIFCLGGYGEKKLDCIIILLRSHMQMYVNEVLSRKALGGVTVLKRCLTLWIINSIAFLLIVKWSKATCLYNIYKKLQPINLI